MRAESFAELAIALRQQQMQVIEAIRLNQTGSLAATRLAKMKARVTPSEPETEHVTASKIRQYLAKLIPPFFRR